MTDTDMSDIEVLAEDVPGETGTDSGEAVAFEDGDTAADEGSDREAAKYRRRLREVEAERDTLATVVDHLRRAELERIATAGPPGAPRLHTAADVFADGEDLADLLDDDGRVDAALVRARIEERTQDRPYLRADLGPRPPAPTRSQGMSASGPDSPRDTGEAWVDLLRGGRR